MSQQAVSADIIPNSADGIFSVCLQFSGYERIVWKYFNKPAVK
jgi:hypothetical protein